MTQTIIFSKNRAAQLDLLLRSIKERAPDLFGELFVLYEADSPSHQSAYGMLMLEHPSVNSFHQQNFQIDLEGALHLLRDEHICFLCDDDIVTHPFTDNITPGRVLDTRYEVLCFSLRLGDNTDYCYPLGRKQDFPYFSYVTESYQLWKWPEGDGDWGYPGSIDGHFFRREDLTDLVYGMDYNNPNEFEQGLQTRCSKLGVDMELSLMACYESSIITGLPVNRVNTTHPNRSGEMHYRDPALLNSAFLDGQRLALSPIDRKDVKAAHVELPLVFA